jgi:hypothetical protein
MPSGLVKMVGLPVAAIPAATQILPFHTMLRPVVNVFTLAVQVIPSGLVAIVAPVVPTATHRSPLYATPYTKPVIGELRIVQVIVSVLV